MTESTGSPAPRLHCVPATGLESSASCTSTARWPRLRWPGRRVCHRRPSPTSSASCGAPGPSTLSAAVPAVGECKSFAQLGATTDTGGAAPAPVLADSGAARCW